MSLDSMSQRAKRINQISDVILTKTKFSLVA